MFEAASSLVEHALARTVGVKRALADPCGTRVVVCSVDWMVWTHAFMERKTVRDSVSDTSYSIPSFGDITWLNGSMAVCPERAGSWSFEIAPQMHHSQQATCSVLKHPHIHLHTRHHVISFSYFSSCNGIGLLKLPSFCMFLLEIAYILKTLIEPQLSEPC